MRRRTRRSASSTSSGTTGRFGTRADTENLFAKMLADSGLEAQWPWGYEDPERLDWDQLLTRYSRAWHE